MSAVGLQTHIWNNNFKSLLLLAGYPFLILGMFWACAFVISYFLFSNATPDTITPLANNIFANYWPMVVGAVLIWFTVAYFFHTRMIRRMAHSHPVTRDEEPALYNLLENLCITAGIPMPKLEIIESHARNAFASGIDRKSFSVTVTRGLLQSLSKDEVEGVLAHELTHIMNRDVRLLIITIIFTGMIGFAAQVMWSQMRYGIWAGPRRSSGGKNNGVIILFVIMAVLWMGYFATLFTRFAISRHREYMADAGAVQLTRKPEAMMYALMRISGKDQIPKIPADVTMMCIENHKPFMGLFATHPPIAKRIKALSEMTNSSINEAPELIPFYAPQAKRENWTTRKRFKRNRTNPWQRS